MCCWLNSTHILMLHVFEQPELPVSPLSKYLWLERPVELLNGHFLFSPLIYCWAVVNNGTPSHYLCTHEPLRFTTISFFRSREKTTWWSVLRFRLLGLSGGACGFKNVNVSVRQLMMWMLALLCRAPVRGRKSLFGYLQPLPPTHIAHTLV